LHLLRKLHSDKLLVQQYVGDTDPLAY